MYENDELNISSDAFNQDFDEIGFEPVEVDDTDDEAAEFFGY